MDSLNKVIMIGRAGHAVEEMIKTEKIRYVKFCIAIDERYTDKHGNKVKETQWFNVVLFGKLADKAHKSIEKGSKVSIVGKLINTTYIDRNDVKRFNIEIHVSELIIL